MTTSPNLDPLAATPVAIAPKQPRSLAFRRNVTGWLFISPFVLGFIFWFLIPAAIALYLSVHRWNLISEPQFIGLDNYAQLFKDPLLPQAMKATVLYTVISVPIGLLLSFGLAMLLNNQLPGIGIFRTIFYLPTIIPAVASAALWAWMFNTEFGLINVIIRAFGGPKIPWLQSPGWALPAIIIISLWSVGGSMIIFLAGLQGIPDIYYEAADIDGAGRWTKLRHITLPLMSPVFFFNLVIGFISSFQVFIAGYLITDGGPVNATLFLVLYIYRTAFRSLNMGYAAVMSWLLFFILMGLSFLVFRYIGNRVYYETPGEG
ncbi:MAG: sugar ABC transporter permease [Chloroflexi bacterium]|nr:sugar ABC transporter permease [Chloroflexota bacterium]